MTENKELGVWGYIKPLFCDNGSGFSIGRILLIAVTIPAMKLWWAAQEIPEYQLYSAPALQLFPLDLLSIKHFHPMPQLLIYS